MRPSKVLTKKELDSEVQKALKKGKKKVIPAGEHLYCVFSSRKTISFAVRFPTTGKRKTIGSFSVLSLAEARAIVKEILSGEKNANKKEEEHKESSRKFGEYADEWKESKKANPNIEGGHKNDKCYKNTISALKILTGLRDYNLDEITPKLVDKILSQLDRTPYAKSHSIQILNQCLNAAEVEGLIKVNRCKNMLRTTSAISLKYRFPPKNEFKWEEPWKLKKEFFEKLQNGGKVKYKYFLLLATFTTLRDGALACSKWDWVDLKNKVMHVPGKYMKKGRDFDIPITIFIEVLLVNWKKYCEENGCLSENIFCSETSLLKPMNVGMVQVFVAKNVRAKIHGLRKSAATWIASLGISGIVRKAVLSHKEDTTLALTYNKYDYLSEKRSTLRLWGYFVYEYQLPESFKKLFHGINPELLERYKQDYINTTQQIEFAKNNIY